MTVMPSFLLISSRYFMTEWLVAGSRLATGSSASMSSGRCMSAREMPSSARVPVGYVLTRSVIETSAATAATLDEHARRIAPAGVFEAASERYGALVGLGLGVAGGGAGVFAASAATSMPASLAASR